MRLPVANRERVARHAQGDGHLHRPELLRHSRQPFSAQGGKRRRGEPSSSLTCRRRRDARPRRADSNSGICLLVGRRARNAVRRPCGGHRPPRRSTSGRKKRRRRCESWKKKMRAGRDAPRHLHLPPACKRPAPLLLFLFFLASRDAFNELAPTAVASWPVRNAARAIAVRVNARNAQQKVLCRKREKN